MAIAQYSVQSSNTLTTNLWYHVAGSYDGSVARLYVNGVLQGSIAIPLILTYDNTPLLFGTAGFPGYGGRFQGQLDEVSLYNRALTTDETAAIYYAGSAGKNGGAASLRLPLASPIPSANGQLVISWPGYATDYLLQSTTNLMPPIAWLPVTNLPAMSGRQNVVTIPPVRPGQFYRLIK